jgi:putative PIN family toxin of toxin-antitoxin system
MKVVLDVNIWVSGLLWGGVPGQVLRLSHNKKIISIVSEELLLELENTLLREKFRERLRQRGYNVDNLLTVAKTLSQIVVIDIVPTPEMRDPADLKILATAVVAQADVIVTGDQDLLVMGKFQGIEILTPTEFYSSVN